MTELNKLGSYAHLIVDSAVEKTTLMFADNITKMATV